MMAGRQQDRAAQERRARSAILPSTSLLTLYFPTRYLLATNYSVLATFRAAPGTMALTASTMWPAEMP